MNSKILNLNKNDFTKGLIIAVLTAVLTIVYNTIQSGVLTFDYKNILVTAITAGLAYLLKNLNTNSNGKFMSKE